MKSKYCPTCWRESSSSSRCDHTGPCRGGWGDENTLNISRRSRPLFHHPACQLQAKTGSSQIIMSSVWMHWAVEPVINIQGRALDESLVTKNINNSLYEDQRSSLKTFNQWQNMTLPHSFLVQQLIYKLQQGWGAYTALYIIGQSVLGKPSK